MLAVLVSLLLPVTAATADEKPPAAEECAELTLAPFGDPGDTVESGTLTGGTQKCYTMRAEAGEHLFLLRDNRNEVMGKIEGPDGPLDCYASSSQAGRCAVPAAGEYTVRVRNDGVDTSDFRFFVVPLTQTERCADPIGTSWDQPVQERTTAKHFQVDCQWFDAKPGERVVTYASTKVYGDVTDWITDETGAQICPRDFDRPGCALPGDGPYRVLSFASSDETPVRYGLQIARLNDPQGCPEVSVGRYGAPPAFPSAGVRCRILKVPAEGRYQVQPVDDRNGEHWTFVYDKDSNEVCRGGWCTFPAAGSYLLVVGDPNRVNDSEYATAYLDRTGTEGCVKVPEGRYDGRLDASGQWDCLELPTTEESRYSLQIRRGNGPLVSAEVVDANGAYQCGADVLGTSDCRLTGTPPYRVLLSADEGEEPGPYALTLRRTDGPPPAHCAVMPQSAFGDESKATRLTTGDGVFTHCLAIPADAHSAGEVFQIRNTSGNTFANFAVTDSAGDLKCERNSVKDGWSVCPLTPGKAHTVDFRGQDLPATYTLTRRDVTATAKGCTQSAATTVGGPSQPGTVGAAGDLSCHRVTTAAATDRLHLDVRDALGTVNLLPLGADGEAVGCSFRNRSCVATGSTSYQLLTQVPAGLKSPGTYRVDAWRIATADGPAKECPRAASVAYGYGPVTGKLTEERTAVCAVLPTVAHDWFDVTAEDTSGGDVPAGVSYYVGTAQNSCGTGTGGPHSCNVPRPATGTANPGVLVVSLPDKVSELPFRAEAVCGTPCGGERFRAESVTPGSAPSGSTVELTVRGTALHKNDEVNILVGGKRHAATVTSVSSDWRTLKASLNLTGVQPGTYTVSVISHRGIEMHPGSLEVTAPLPQLTGTFEPVQPTRLMDTRSGLGVPKAQVGPQKTVTLQVAGKGGVPASGVTAVVLNVTATKASASSYVSVYPAGTQRTSASNLNVAAGVTVPNLVVVPVKDGKVTFYNNAGSLDLIADVSGYYTSGSGGSTFEPVQPTRLMDTRSGLGAPKAQVGAQKTVTLQVAGKGGVPASGVTAVVLNVTATKASASSYVSVYPAGTQRTSASNLNVAAGKTRPNLVVVPVKDGKVTFYNNAGSLDLIADVSGYYTEARTGSTYRTVQPTRLMDTRSGLGVPKAQVGAQKTVTLQVAGKGGVPASGVTAVVLNVTATKASASSYVSVYPAGTQRTSASNLNVAAGVTVPNLVVVPVKDGKVTFYNNAGSLDLIADVSGYYTR
ncbi:Tat pathway signal protein [Streptomyces sp. NPDC005805]|uniref:Tat pathway signal protein n=1 Tax=Streptomyces sp. NPDC005805 TaxID=3157068 RepID=UPI0033E9CE0C